MNGHAQRMSEIAAYLRGRKDGDYMDKDAAIHCEQAMHELIRQDARVAELEALLGEAPHSELCGSMASGWVAGLEVAPGDLDCNCFKSRA